MRSSNELRRVRLASAVFVLAIAACTHPGMTSRGGAPSTLKDAFAGSFRVGAALNENQFTGRDADRRGAREAQFNTITPENVLKWEIVHPQPGDVRLLAGRSVRRRSATRNGMFIVGHTLVWHSQMPRWVFQDATGKPLDARCAARPHARPHLHGGRPLQGTHQGVGRRQRGARTRTARCAARRGSRSSATTIIVKAFQFAHEADPAARALLQRLLARERAQAERRRRAGEEAQGGGHSDHRGRARRAHDKMDWPTRGAGWTRPSPRSPRLGVKVNITELDVDVLAAGDAESDAPTSAYARQASSGRESVRRRPARLGAAALAAAVRRPVSRFLQAPGRHRSHYLLGRRRRRFVAEQLARARTDELSVAVRPRRIARSRRSTR